VGHIENHGVASARGDFVYRRIQDRGLVFIKCISSFHAVFSNLVFLLHEFDIANNFGYFKKQCTERDMPLLITEVVVPTLNREWQLKTCFRLKICSLSFVLIVIGAITK